MGGISGRSCGKTNVGVGGDDLPPDEKTIRGGAGLNALFNINLRLSWFDKGRGERLSERRSDEGNRIACGGGFVPGARVPSQEGGDWGVGGFAATFAFVKGAAVLIGASSKSTKVTTSKRSGL
jgi:hypothetical protein